MANLVSAFDKKRISPKVKDLVFGYIGIIQKLFPQNKAYYNVPDDIKFLCSLFYIVEDYFFAAFTPNTFKIDDEDKRLIKVEDSTHSAFLSNLVFRDKHHWKFLIEKCSPSCDMMIGVYKNIEDPSEKQMLTYLGAIPNTSYVLNTSFGATNDHTQKWYGFSTPSSSSSTVSNPGELYGIICHDGCIVDMHLDFVKSHLSFSMNGTDYGKLHDIDNTVKYRACVSIYNNGDTIKLVSYNID